MDAYVYLLLCCAFLFCSGVIFLFRKDLRKRILLAGTLGAFMGPLAEIWYWVDYWRPPSVLQFGPVAIEDVLLGISLAVLSTTIYETVSGRQTIQKDKSRRGLFLALLASNVLALIIFTNLLHFNSLFVTCAIFLLSSIFMIAHRRDLLFPGVMSGLLLVALSIPLYFVLFELVAPRFWSEYWMLYGTRYGWILGDALPFTEFLWYFCWGMLAGTAPYFYSGTAPQKLPGNGLQAFGKMFKKGLGVLCIIVGVGALVTPFTPGAWLIIVGLELMGLSFLIPERYRKKFREMRKKMWK